MTKKQFLTLVGRIAPHLPEAKIKFPMIIFPPAREVLRGLYFERSGSDSRRFYLWAFFMPMCVPSQQVSFNLGRRLGDADQRWDLDDPDLDEKMLFAIRAEGLPFLEKVRTPVAAARFAKATAETAKSPYVLQASAYMYARAGEATEAIRSLVDLLQVLELQVSWQAEIASRAQKLKALLNESPKEAEMQLRAWEDETARNLGLREL